MAEGHVGDGDPGPVLRRTVGERPTVGIAATLAVAGVRGLLLDLLATGDRARVDEAAARLGSFLQSEAAPDHRRASVAAPRRRKG